MPRPIKKKISKPAPGQDDVMGLVGKVRETAAARQRQLTVAAVALAALIVLIVGLYYYQTNSRREAQRLQAAGMKILEGNTDDSAALPEDERARKALELFNQAYEKRKSPDSLMYIAESQATMGEYEQAIATLDRLLTDYPGNIIFSPMAKFKKATLYLKAGDKQKALDTLDSLAMAKTGVPFEDMALMESARILDGMGRAEDAKSKYEILVNDHPESPYAAEARDKLGLDKKELKSFGEGQSPVPASPDSGTKPLEKK